MSESSSVWSRKECLLYYQESCAKIVQSLETKELNWQKLFEDNEKNIRSVLNVLLWDGDNKKYKFNPFTTNKPKQIRMKRKLADGETTNQRKKSNNNDNKNNSQSNSFIKKKTIKSLKSKKSTETFNSFNNSLLDINNEIDQTQSDEAMLENVGLDDLGFNFDEDDDILLDGIS